MCIKNSEHQFFKNYWQRNFPNATIYLFGSRADDAKKGGDIDLLILNDEKITLSQKIKFLGNFMLQFGEQRIDLVTYTYSKNVPFKNITLSSSIPF